LTASLSRRRIAVGAAERRAARVADARAGLSTTATSVTVSPCEPSGGATSGTSGAGEAAIELIVANPPYIDERDLRVEEGVKHHEPHSALFADENGLGCLRRWSTTTFPRLASGGLMIFEIGDGQGASIKAHFEELGLSEVKVHRDLAGLERAVVGRKP
jgi:methylase of polypeptide subunit release factors